MENKYRDLHELPVTLRVEDLMPILGIGRNTAYQLIRSGQIRSVRIGIISFAICALLTLLSYTRMISGDKEEVYQ